IDNKENAGLDLPKAKTSQHIVGLKSRFTARRNQQTRRRKHHQRTKANDISSQKMSRGSLSHTAPTGTNDWQSIALVVGIGHFPPNFCALNDGFRGQTRVAARARDRSPIANENQRFGRVAARGREGSLRKSAQHYAKSFQSA